MIKMISVVMANFNGEKFIEEAISSVINQDYDDYEFIIVDDGSEDRSRDIISDWKIRYPSKIKSIFMPVNRGQGSAFNIGITESKGDPICFIDSDDIWFPNKLKNVNESIDKQRDYSIHQHNLLVIRHGELTNEKFREVLISGDYFKYTKRTNLIPDFVPTSGLTFARHALSKVLPIPEEFKTCADGFLTRTCFCYGDIVSDNECWGAYRIHNANNIFENPNFDINLYLNDLLIPSLNQFYSEKNIDLRYTHHKTNLQLRPGSKLLTKIITSATAVTKKLLIREER
ncbi:glycosyltransferase [Chloroflexota bacterium]